MKISSIFIENFRGIDKTYFLLFSEYSNILREK